MLSVLLSVEELELLVIRHVSENRLHFLAFVSHFPSTFSYHHQAMVPILRHIVITDFNPVLYCYFIFHSFYFSSRTENVLKHPLHFEVYEIIFPTSHHMHEMGSEQESCANFTLAMQSVQG
jgi:hypothetical protein